MIVERRSVFGRGPGRTGVPAKRRGRRHRASSRGQGSGEDPVIGQGRVAGLAAADQPLGVRRRVAQAVAGLDLGQAACAAGRERTVVAAGPRRCGPITDRAPGTSPDGIRIARTDEAADPDLARDLAGRPFGGVCVSRTSVRSGKLESFQQDLQWPRVIATVAPSGGSVPSRAGGRSSGHRVPGRSRSGRGSFGHPMSLACSRPRVDAIRTEQCDRHDHAGPRHVHDREPRVVVRSARVHGHRLLPRGSPWTCPLESLRTRPFPRAARRRCRYFRPNRWP